VASQGTSPKTITSLDFLPGTLGDFYYPTTVNGQNLATLINAGYTPANILGLCPFTVCTDQTREGTTTADIGFHYVALDSSGNPQDDNINNTPDYLETPVADPQTLGTACNDSPPLTITLTGSGITCGPLTFIIVTGPNQGSLGTISQISDTSAQVTYTPNSSYCGPVSFTFKVRDNGKDSAPATVSMSFASANATANCKDLMVAVNTTTTFTLTGSGNCITPFTKLSDPAVGQITQFNPTTGQVTYQSGSVEGDGSFSFSVANCGQGSPTAEVTIKVVPAPTLTTECRPTSIILSWTLPPFLEALAVSGYIQDFQIFKCSGVSCTPSTTPIATISDPLITQNPQLWKFVDTSVSSGQSYCYSIKFRHNNNCAVTPPLESPISTPVCATTCCPPAGDFWTDSNFTAQQLAEFIMAGSGITVVPNSAFFGGAASTLDRARGIFGSGSNANLPIENGVILCSGDIGLAKGPNLNVGPIPGSLGAVNSDTVGDPDFNGLVSGISTRDASILVFDVTTSVNNAPIKFEYVFASEEYHFYIGSINDIMAIWVDGQNVAVVPGTSPPDPIAVNYIHNGKPGIPPKNAGFFVDNETTVPGPFNVQYNGFTTLLTTASKTITSGSSHRVKISIADANDAFLDSAVFIKATTCQQ
jgi:hypothetical protein